MKMVIMLAVTTTLRRGEVLALHWQDIDWRGQKIRVQRSLAYTKERGLFEKEPKSATSKREISLPSFITDELKKYQASQASQQSVRQIEGKPWQDHDLVFCNLNGSHFSLPTLNTRLARILEKAGLPKMRFHDLRHSAVTILLKMGIPPHVVQEIAGHSDIRTTLQIYGHVLPGQQGEAMQKWDKVLEERDPEKHTRIQQQWEHYNADVQACLEVLLNKYGEGAVQIALQAIAHAQKTV